MEQTPTIGELLRAAAGRLAPHSQTPRLDAELLLGHVLGWQRARLVAESRARIEPAQRAEFARLLERREALEPVAYLVGK